MLLTFGIAVTGMGGHLAASATILTENIFFIYISQKIYYIFVKVCLCVGSLAKQHKVAVGVRMQDIYVLFITKI
jgi:hypothetical protein